VLVSVVGCGVRLFYGVEYFWLFGFASVSCLYLLVVVVVLLVSVGGRYCLSGKVGLCWVFGVVFVTG